jgi:hypothetical protein
LENEIVINKYVSPVSLKGNETSVKNLFKDKKQLLHILIHELIHYAFTEYEYTDDGNEPSNWTVGLCSKESTSSYAEKEYYKKWKIDEWLDEVLTERLAMHVSGWEKTGALLYENNVRERDKPVFEKIKEKIINGPILFEDIVKALYYHNGKFFLDY